MPPTPEQRSFIDHTPSQHARVLAGPGTGKSWTAVQFLERLSRDVPGLRARMLTFTRAATAEFAKKLGDAELEGLGVAAPATIHSFALGLLLRHPDACGLPLPVRIAGRWELENLVRPALRNLLKEAVPEVSGTSVRTVAALETWMAAGWESLDPDLPPDDRLDPRLISVFTGIWAEHRAKFGYVLVGELPYRAGQMLEDLQLDEHGLDLLLVDEYQDLNRADIKLLELVVDAGVVLIGIGDDDQSIYSFRMAHPEGIRRFLANFDTVHNYPLTVSHRCGGNVLEAATALIEADPSRAPKPRLTGRPGGTFAYLRFSSDTEEIDGVADLVARRIAGGVEPGDIALLVRSQVATWARNLEPALRARGVTLATTDWVDKALREDDELRRGIALSWLALDATNSLAWWTLLTLSPGVGDAFIAHVANTGPPEEPFAATLLRLHTDGFRGAPSRSAATAAVDGAMEVVRRIEVENAVLGDLAWGGWLLEQVDVARLGDEGRRLLELVGPAIPPSEGLRGFLTQLEPLGGDLAANEAEGVRLMTMGGSKGLTVNTAVTLGVEEGLVPMPAPRGDVREERRLLFVAMTRATDMCVLTWTSRRSGSIAHLGTPSFGARRQSPLLRDLPAITSQPGRPFVSAL